jgi:hypothetical protein
MATARVIPPKEDFDPALLITITSTGVAPAQATPIISNGQPVTFTNVSPSQATITFVPDPVNVGQWLFGSGIPVTLAAATNPPNPNSSKTLSPNYPNRTVNYSITIAGNPIPFGPYAIQVGTPGPSPLFIAVNNDITTPDPVVVPVGGWIEMVSLDTYTYDVTWTPSNPFGLTQIKPGIGNNSPVQDQPRLSLVYRYSIAPKAGLAQAHGGGTIKVGS